MAVQNVNKGFVYIMDFTASLIEIFPSIQQILRLYSLQTLTFAWLNFHIKSTRNVDGFR